MNLKKVSLFAIILIALFVLNACLTNEVEFSITFESNGGSSVQSVLSDGKSSIQMPDDPIKDEHVFAGWYFDNLSFTDLFTITSLSERGLNSNLIVYAKWTANTYIVSFETNGGEVINSITQDYNTHLVFPNEPTKLGYTFSGWYAEQEFNIPIESLVIPAQNTTLYAKWTINQYIIAFSSSGGSEIDNITLDYTLDVIELNEPTREGYTFEGWYNNREFSGEPIIEIILGTNQNITLYAKWLIDQYTITYNIMSHDPLSYIILNTGETISQMSLGISHSSALTSGGRLFMWGRNGYGQLGDNSTTTKTNPIEITSRFNLESGDEIIQVSLGYIHSSALTSSGRLFMWGENGAGSLGDNSTTNHSLPTEITNLFYLENGDKIIEVSLGYDSSSALTSSGRLFVWGYNRFGQLGNNSTTNLYVPTEITSRFILELGDKIIQVSMRQSHSSALTSSGRLFMWGDNFIGKLGDNSTIQRLVPTEITLPFILANGDKIIQVSLGISHSSALTHNGRLFMWGIGGSLGNNQTTNSSFPTEITNQFTLVSGDKIIQVSLGGHHSSALTSSGRLFMWGRNGYGELGDDTKTYKLAPFEVTNLFSLDGDDRIVRMSLGEYNSSALTQHGKLFMWGYNGAGQIGDGTYKNNSVPTQIKISHLETYNTVIYAFNQNTSALVPVKPGYTFSGWYTDIYLTTPYIFTTLLSGNITLYGKWIVN